MTERLQKELENLPVAALVKPLNETLRRESAAIVTAAPGAGKSTVLPLTILEGLREGTGKIVVLEPRRVAARQIASRMAWLLGESVGETVGYRIRFESKASVNTRIEVVTEGVLTRMLLDDVDADSQNCLAIHVSPACYWWQTIRNDKPLLPTSLR